MPCALWLYMHLTALYMQASHGPLSWPAAMLLLHEHEVRQAAVLRGCGWPILSSQGQYLVSVLNT